MPRNVKHDISGQRFGRYTAIRFLPDDAKHASFLCRCDCGTERAVLSQSLRRGASTSCGCASPRSIRHGHAKRDSRSPTYGSWASMMTRCEWPDSGAKAYAKYGARGIRVAPRWHDFNSFMADMGERPNGTSLDRIDGAKGYEPGNCRWASRRRQNLNTSRTVRVTYLGAVTTAMELCEQLGISYKALLSRKRRRGGDCVAAFQSFGVSVNRVGGSGELGAPVRRAA